MKKNRWMLVCPCWLAISAMPLLAEEPVQPKSSKWDVVKEYLRRNPGRRVNDSTVRPVATGTVGGASLERMTDAAWARQTYKLEHNGYAPYQEFVVVDLVTKEKRTKVVGFLPDEGKFVFLSPSTPKLPKWLTVGKTRASRNGFSFKIGSPDGSEVFSFFDSTDEVAPWFFDKYSRSPAPVLSASGTTTLELLRQKLNQLKSSRQQCPPEVAQPKE